MKPVHLILALSLLAMPVHAMGVGQPAPKLTAKTLDGKTFDVAAYRGKVVLVSFWATWCAPCRAEMPALDAYYKAHRAEGLEMVAISMDDPVKDKAVARIMASYSFPGAHGRDAKYDGYGHIGFLPVVFIIDRGGVIRWDGNAQPNPVAFDGPRLEAMVTPLLHGH